MTVKEFYTELEKKENFIPINPPSIEIMSKQEQTDIQMEFCAFLQIKSVLETPLIQTQKQNAIDYYTKRECSTKNIFLRSRYVHLLYLLTHKKFWLELAVQLYKEIINMLYLDEEKSFLCYKVFRLALSLLKLQRSFVISEFKPLLTDLLCNSNDKLKRWLLKIAEEYKIYKIEELGLVITVCEHLALKKGDYYFIKDIADFGIYFANKDSKKYKYQLYKFYELLGDNESLNLKDIENNQNNIALPHINQNIYKKQLECYKKAHCVKKYNQTMIKYSDNKKNLKFLSVPINYKINPEIIPLLENHFDNILNLETNLLLAYLVLGDDVIFLPNQYLINKSDKLYEYNKWVRTVWIDLNLNERQIEQEEYEKFFKYNISINSLINSLVSVIISAVIQKKISYTKLQKFLKKKTCFGSNLNISRFGIELNYNWFQQIDFVLQDFFKQINLYLKNKEPDWRLVIDVLPSKFEGILREMIGMSDRATTKLKNGDTSEKLLDSLLEELDSLQIFTIDDINLFKYVFTNKGLNIRNYVAHGFYKPQDYSIQKAVLVFMCIMRLAKFPLYIK